MMELQELFLTAFVSLVFSFLIAKLVSVAVSAANGDFVESDKKGIDEIVKLKVGGAKSKKRVRFAVDEVVEKVEKFSGEEGLVGEEVEEFCGVEGGESVTCLEGGKGEEIVVEGNTVNEELGRVIGSGGELGSDEQSWEVIRVLEDLGGDEKRENVGSDEIVDELVENSGLDELVFTERNESEVGGDEESVRFVCGDVTGDQSGKVRVLEEFAEGRSGNSGMEV